TTARPPPPPPSSTLSPYTTLFRSGIQAKIPDKVGSNIYAVYSDYASDHNGAYTYVIGAMVKDGTAPPEGMVAIRIPAGQYTVLRSEEHTSELQSLAYLVCRLLLEK